MNGTLILHEIGQDPMFKIWHASKEAMFLYIHSDGGSIVCSEKTYPIKKGTLCFIGAGKYHYTMPDTPAFYDRSKLFISSEFIKKSIQLLSVSNKLHAFTEDGFLYAHIPLQEQVNAETLFSRLHENQNHPLRFEMLLYSCCLELFFLLDKYALDAIPASTNSIHPALDYIHQHIFSNIDIDNICASIPMSKYYFCRKFKQITGLTVMNYILQTRLIHAQNMLVKENLSITEISEHCGFSSTSYFCRVFKEANHMTPLEYRRSYR